MVIEKWYRCEMQTNIHLFNVNVFTSSKDKEIIKILAIDRAKQLLKEFEIKHKDHELKFNSFKELKGRVLPCQQLSL